MVAALHTAYRRLGLAGADLARVPQPDALAGCDLTALAARV
ncbi:hypothetical protein O7607_03340 [Micromonospora sp. WMMA1949]|nr:hypothetical protein [Micromonospora sp. WMMA1949]MCZ7424761.1 hypothetical protein [Micromonospora sp. WMMA1949]